MFSKEGGPFGSLKHHKSAPPEHVAPAIGGVVVESYADHAPSWSAPGGYWTKCGFDEFVAKRLLTKKGWKEGVRVKNLFVQWAKAQGDKLDYRVTGQLRVVQKVDGEMVSMWKKFDVVV